MRTCSPAAATTTGATASSPTRSRSRSCRSGCCCATAARTREQARDAYLEGFGGRELVETLELACRVAKIARTLTWVRAAPGEDAAGQQLATLLEETYV